MDEIKKEINEIKLRNQRVEADKAWETSSARKISIAIVTYLFMTILFYSLGDARPYVSSLVPTCGYLLSTLGLSLIKRLWLERLYKK